MLCSVENCDRLSEKRGFCCAHYQRHRKGKDLSKPVRNCHHEMKVCNIKDCPRKHYAKNYCKAHYDRSTRGIDMDNPLRIRNGKQGCKVKGCERKHYSNEYCNLHNVRVKNGTAPDRPIMVHDGKQGCSVIGCENKHDRRSLCVNHAARIEFRERKKNLVDRFKATCCDCGNIYPPNVFDFDNVDISGRKHVRISKLIQHYASDKRIDEELEYCEMVCSNCHRTRTHSRYPEMIIENDS